MLTWHAAVSAVKTENGPGAKPRRVAVVDLTPHRWEELRATTAVAAP